MRHLFAGIEHASSFIVDPHKWLFASFDGCALLYREPALARAAHTQKASCRDVLDDAAEWNPADCSIGLTRRAGGLTRRAGGLTRRAGGLPLWFSLATYGTAACTAAIERTLEVTRFAGDEIARRSYLEALHEADLSVVVFRRLGWEAEDYYAWSDELLREELAFVSPTTTEDGIIAILDTMT
ncbi:MAG: pyridoxal-dependent decarboxylase [Dermatophilaceae bacterium]